MTAIGQAIFLMVLAVFAAIGLLVMSRRTRARDSLRRRLGQLTGEGGDSLVRTDDQTEEDSFARTLAESGLGWTIGMFLTRVALAGGIGLVLGVAIGSPLLALVLGLCGAAVLWVVVRAARARRLAQCDEQMPQALEIMALALRAGHALPSALRLAGEESPAPLCHELRRAADEHALGRPIVDVLAGLGRRLPGCDAVNTFVVAVAVLQETGGNLIGVIDRIVDNARARASYQARLRALTAEGRQSARLLAFLPGAFALAAMTTDPSYGRTLLGSSGGRLILLAALALWGAGLLWIRRLVRPVS